MLFDTHAHYDSEAFDGDRHDLLSSLPEKGVSLALCPASNVESAFSCVRLAEQYPHLYAAVGVHPESAHQILPSYLDTLRPLFSHPKVKAVGEIGLDYYWSDGASRPVQRSVFRQQMDLAQELSLPVILHDREAHGDMLQIVKEYPSVQGVFHCYSGSLEQAKVLVGLGHYLSFTGTITFKNARKAPEVIRWMPLERIMIETDAPYMAPTPFRGKRNDSTYVYRMAEAIAQLKGMSTEDVIHITTENGKRFFRIGDERRHTP